MDGTRRRALAQFLGWAAASPLLQAQSPHAPRRKPPAEEIINTAEMRDAAEQSIPRAEFERIESGTGSGRTLRRNREFFERISFRPRMLVDVSGLDLEIELFGRKAFAPILAGPTARHARAHPDGEIATAAGCSAAKSWMVASQNSSRPWSEIGRAAGETWWAQASPSSDAGRLNAQVEEAAATGAHALVLTLDASAARPDSALHNGAARGVPPRPRTRAAAAEAIAAAKRGGLPVVVKGVLSPGAANAAIEAGADGLIVSNHGGRSVDGAPAAVEALPRVAEAAARRVPVLIDGGFRRGSDVLKALALGADAVLLGRPILWGLAAYGSAGVQRVLELMQSELALAMGLSGTPTVADAGPNLVKIRRW